MAHQHDQYDQIHSSGLNDQQSAPQQDSWLKVTFRPKRWSLLECLARQQPAAQSTRWWQWGVGYRVASKFGHWTTSSCWLNHIFSHCKNMLTSSALVKLTKKVFKKKVIKRYNINSHHWNFVFGKTPWTQRFSQKGQPQPGALMPRKLRGISISWIGTPEPDGKWPSRGKYARYIYFV